MLRSLSPRVWYMPADHRTDRPVLGLVAGTRHSLIVDSGTSPRHAREFLDAATDLSVPEPAYLVLTHWHWDHVFGIETMHLPTFAHAATEAHLCRLRRLDWTDQGMAQQVDAGLLPAFSRDCLLAEIPRPEQRMVGPCHVRFEGRVEIDLGATVCEVEHIGGPHTEDGVVIMIPDQRVVFLGDCVYGRRHNGVYGYDRNELLPMLDRIEALNADWFIVSHEEPLDRVAMQRHITELRLIERCTEGLAGPDGTARAAQLFREATGANPTEEQRFQIECFTGPAATRS